MQRINDQTEIDGTAWYVWRTGIYGFDYSNYSKQSALRDEFKDSDFYVSCLAFKFQFKSQHASILTISLL